MGVTVNDEINIIVIVSTFQLFFCDNNSNKPFHVAIHEINNLLMKTSSGHNWSSGLDERYRKLHTLHSIRIVRCPKYFFDAIQICSKVSIGTLHSFQPSECYQKIILTFYEAI